MAETTAEYKTRVMSYTQGETTLTLLAATPKKIAKLVGKATPAKLKRSPAPGKWSAAEILAHLADAEAVLAWRFRSVLGQPGIGVQGYDQDAWARNLKYAQRPVAASLAAFLAIRQFNLALLKSLAPAQWKVEGLHSERGPETIETIARMLAGHDVNHLRQLEGLLQSKK